MCSIFHQNAQLQDLSILIAHDFMPMLILTINQTFDMAD